MLIRQFSSYRHSHLKAKLMNQEPHKSQKQLRNSFDRRDDGDGSGSIIAPPGAGKTSRIFIPTLLTDPRTQIVFDPAVDIYETTREKPGRSDGDVSVVCPFQDDAN